MGGPAKPGRAEVLRALKVYAKHKQQRGPACRELGMARTTLFVWIQNAEQWHPGVTAEAGLDDAPTPTDGATKRDRLGKLADLLDASGIPIDEIARVKAVRVSDWQGLTKGEDGQPVITDLRGSSIILTPKWAEGPAWPVIQQAPAVNVKPMALPTRKAARGDGWRMAVVLPDVQIGYYRRGESLVPTHDERALAVALEVTRRADPDVVVMLGDNLDFPELSKYRKHPTFQRTTQAAIDRATRLAASIRARIRPECRIVWIAGNHEERLPNYIVDNAVAAFALKRGQAPESWPVLSVPFLCRFDEHGVEFLPGYPASRYWINDNLCCIHGDRVRTGGSTAHAYLSDIRHSVIFGHVHRREFAAVTRMTKAGARTYHSACFGCLCRIDGAVPGYEAGHDLDGLPIETTCNWQQAVGLVEYQEGDGDFAMEAVEIWGGRARWRGQTIEAPADVVEAA